jgi:hypothetical protein
MSQDILSRLLSTELSASHSGAKLKPNSLKAPPTEYKQYNLLDIELNGALPFPFPIDNFLAILRFHGRGTSPIGSPEIASFFFAAGNEKLVKSAHNQ